MIKHYAGVKLSIAKNINRLDVSRQSPSMNFQHPAAMMGNVTHIEGTFSLR
jgi:hypothetical protein